MFDDEARYAIIHGRDARFDGQFYTAVHTTGIYCRPSCPARTPARANVSFYPTAAAAQQAGYRACKRCEPEHAPGSPMWSRGGHLVARALQLIDDGMVEREGVGGLAARLGYSQRQLARILEQHLGATPVSLAVAHRLHHARSLLASTELPVADIAHASGFGSVRRFNEAAQRYWGESPSRVRGRAGGMRQRTDGATAAPGGAIELRLRFRQPCDFAATVRFLAERAVAGVESVSDGAYSRAMNLAHGPALMRATPAPMHLNLALELADPADLPAAVARVRRLFDLDADPHSIAQVLGSQPRLERSVSAMPGLRVPGAVDGFEIAVRAIVGQQVSVAGARTTLGRIAALWGEGHTLAGEQWTLFPSPQALVDVDPGQGLIPAAKWRAIGGVASAMLAGELDLGPGADIGKAREVLGDLPGVGAWTVEYVAMRALGDPDAFPASDLVLMRAAGLDAGALAAASQAWRPWRAYAALHLWNSSAPLEERQ